MDLTIVPRPLFPQPPDNGTHQLAWDVVLDTVFADAYHAGIGEIIAHVPMPRVEELLQLRARLTRAKGTGRALVCSGLFGLGDDLFDRVYTIEHGGVMGGRLRTHTAAAHNRWTARHQMWVYTLRSRLIGIPIRVGQLMNAPWFADRMSFRARRAFVSRRPALAYYHVTVWEPSTPGNADHAR